MAGHMGKLARIDLSTGETQVEDISEEVRRKYIGGTALSAYIMRANSFS